MSKDDSTLSFWEVVAKVDKDDYLYDIKQKGSFFFTFSLPQHIVFITDKLFFLSLSLSLFPSVQSPFAENTEKGHGRGQAGHSQVYLQGAGKSLNSLFFLLPPLSDLLLVQVFISEAMVAACDIALKLHGSNRVYKVSLHDFILSSLTLYYSPIPKEILPELQRWQRPWKEGAGEYTQHAGRRDIR